jgi:phospholipase C
MSGSINVPGSPQTKDQGGYPYIQTNGNSGGDDSGCDSHGIDCLPLKWTTAPEHYQDAGIDWQVFQEDDTAAGNFGDNALVEFEIFRNATSGPLVDRGKQGQTLDRFYQSLKNGTLPEISYIIARPDLSEHVGFGTPNDGGSLQDQVVRALLASPVYNKTALIISYDEGGGWFDHVIPYTSPNGTAGEWLTDPIAGTGYTFAGPGIRVPMYIVSPWTRNGGVYTEHADHTSQLLFIEKWQEAKGRNVTSNEIVHWRRDNMADLVNAFDFDNPDYSIPNLPTAPKYQGYDKVCHDKNGPSPPQSGNGITGDIGSLVEKGFKPVRGTLTEGRHLVLEMNGAALTHPDNGGSQVTTSGATQQHDDKQQQWVINAIKIGGNDFTMKAASDGRYICNGGSLCKDQKSAIVFTLGFQAGSGHTFQVKSSGQYMVAAEGGQVSFCGCHQLWKVYSVNY